MEGKIGVDTLYQPTVMLALAQLWTLPSMLPVK